MSNYPDDYRRDDPDRDERERERDQGDENRDATTIAAARAATALPGLFLILNGLFGIVCVALLSIPMVFQPELLIKATRDFVAKQPQGPQRKDLEDQLDEAEKQIQQNRLATQIQNGIQLGLLLVGNFVAVLGGMAMRSLGNYGLSMTGAIVSIIPVLTGCCCTGMPFGIWAAMVLAKPEVKAGFVANRRARH